MSRSARSSTFREDLRHHKLCVAGARKALARVREAPTTLDAMECLQDAHELTKTADAFAKFLSAEANRVGIAQPLCERIGLKLLSPEEEDQPMSDRDRDKLTAVHEMGHVLLYLVTRTSFLYAMTTATELDGDYVCGAVLHAPIPPGKTVQQAPLSDRLNACVAGGVAEELIYGATTAYGMMADLRTALALLGVTSEADLRDDKVLDALRDAVSETRAILKLHLDMLSALSKELFETFGMTRDDVVAFLRTLGVEVPDAVFESDDSKLVLPDFATWQLQPAPTAANEEGSPEPAATDDDAELAEMRAAFKEALAEAAATKPPQS